jgi:hypothetical protein
VFVLGFAALYFSYFNQYRKTCEKHELLTDLLNNPNARVATGDKAQQVIQTVLANQPAAIP